MCFVLRHGTAAQSSFWFRSLRALRPCEIFLVELEVCLIVVAITILAPFESRSGAAQV
jgi:hypothetical protein